MNPPTMISIILSVRNEEDFITSALDHLRKTSVLFPVEVLVVDGQSTDRTREMAGPWADRVMVSPKTGRGFQMHWGAAHASGALLLFLHIDTRLPENWQAIVAREASQGIPAAAFRLSFDSKKIFYKMLAFLGNFRTRWTGIPHGDQALLVTRRAYFAAGGFPDVPLMEEYIFYPRLRRLGGVKILPESIVTSCRRYEKKGPFQNACKNVFLILLFYLGISPQKLARWY